MVKVLHHGTTQKVLIPRLEEARSFWSRGKGLLGRSDLASDEGLWIYHCNSIHTCFMKFSIDCVFVDKKMNVKAVYQNIPPWRLIGPVWGASSVMELSAGSVERLQLKVGDQLYVGA